MKVLLVSVSIEFPLANYFLAQHLGGLVEPAGRVFADSSIRFDAGQSLIPVLTA